MAGIEDIEDAAKGLTGYENKSGNIGERVRKNIQINRYYDNYLRHRFSLMIFDFFLGLVLFSIISLYYINFIEWGPTNVIDSTIYMSKQFSEIAQEVIVYVGNNYGDRINVFIESMGINEHMKLSFYPVQKLELVVSNPLVPNSFYWSWLVYCFFMILYFSSIFYLYLAQKQLKNSGITTYYLPLIFAYRYYERFKHNRIYVKLIPHLNEENLSSPTKGKKIISYLFKLDQSKITSKDKFLIIDDPKRFLLIYDYVDLSYTINDLSPSEMYKEKVLKEKEEKKKKNLSIKKNKNYMFQKKKNKHKKKK